MERHLGLCFASLAFGEAEMEFIDQSFWGFLSTLTIFSRYDVEGRGSSTRSDRNQGATDYLDGFEMLTKYPLNHSRFYQRLA